MTLNEHIDLKILNPSELKKIPWVEADIEVVNLLMGGIVCKILTII